MVSLNFLEKMPRVDEEVCILRTGVVLDVVDAGRERTTGRESYISGEFRAQGGLWYQLLNLLKELYVCIPPVDAVAPEPYYSTACSSLHSLKRVDELKKRRSTGRWTEKR